MWIGILKALIFLKENKAYAAAGATISIGHVITFLMGAGYTDKTNADFKSEFYLYRHEHGKASDIKDNRLNRLEDGIITINNNFLAYLRDSGENMKKYKKIEKEK